MTPVPLVINARANPTYGGNLINQKYSPLQNIILNPVDANYYRGLYTGRSVPLANINVYPPNALNLYANWPALPPPIVGTPPIVVASSNRAEWMATILQNAAGHGPFVNGYLAADTFDNDVVPWYAPGRSGGRLVYVVVHWSEYDYYVAQLAAFAPGVTVVGYRFTFARPALDIVGFGVSRYCALQLVLNLGYHRAWTVDDNVVNVNGFPATLALVEANMTNVPPIWAISFNAATANITRADLYTGSVTFAAVPYVFANMLPGILQQVVLWNLDLFNPVNLNFCPVFLTSNEDISISNYLQQNAQPEKVITACRTVKIEPVADSNRNVGGKTEVPKRRTRMLSIFAQTESAILIDGGAGQVQLQQFIINTVLPGAGMPSTDASVAQSKAIEQVMAAAALSGWYSPTAFNPYNGPPNVALVNAANL
jgi:hypothetical protein